MSDLCKCPLFMRVKRSFRIAADATLGQEWWLIAASDSGGQSVRGMTVIGQSV
jgi:hypothetical protein